MESKFFGVLKNESGFPNKEVKMTDKKYLRGESRNLIIVRFMSVGQLYMSRRMGRLYNS